MKKIKKIMVGVVSSIMLMSCMSTSAFAYNQTSGYQNSPKLTSPAYGHSYSMYASKFSLSTSKSPAKGDNVETRYRVGGNLPYTIAANNSRKCTIVLWEENPVKDDKIKEYTITYKGFTTSNVYVSNRYISGNIENNEKVELYTHWVLTTHQGDSLSYVNTGALGSYCINTL